LRNKSKKRSFYTNRLTERKTKTKDVKCFMTSAVRAHTSIIETCIFMDNNYVFKTRFYWLKSLTWSSYSPTMSFVVIFLKVRLCLTVCIIATVEKNNKNQFWTQRFFFKHLNINILCRQQPFKFVVKFYWQFFYTLWRSSKPPKNWHFKL